MAKQTDWRGSVSVAVLGMAAAMATSGQAYAQGQPHQEAADNQGLQEIVVTAQFKKQNVQDAPLAITAVNAAMIEARNQTGVASLAQRAPGVQFSAGGEGGGAQTAAVTIRGIGQNDFQFPNDPGVGIYIDDVYYGISFASSFDLVDLDRVEILRGPQGTLSGKNSIGGSIKLYSQLPSAEPNAYIEGTYGSFNRVQIKAASNFTLVPDQLYARFTGMSRHVDGYMTRLDYGCVHGTATPGGSFATPSSGCVIGTEGGQDMFALRGALRWLPAPGIEDNLIVDFAQDNSEPSPEKLLILNGGENYITGPRSYTNYATYTGNVGTSTQYTDAAKSTTRSWGISNNLNVELGHGLSLRSITAYRYASGGSAWDGDASPITTSQEYVTFRHRQFTQELRLSGQVGKWADVTAGAYLYDAHSGDGGRIDIAVAGLDFADNDIFRQTSKSAFAHVVLHPLPGFNITAGLRYTSENKTYIFGRSSPVPGVATNPAVAPLDGVVGKSAADHWDYRVALDYELTHGVRLYGQIATGFKGGGVNPRPYYPQQVVPFGIEQSTSYEAGIKSMLFDRKLRLNADYFHTDYSGYQGQVSACPDISPSLPAGVPVFCGATRNVGDARIDGIELEAEAQPLPGLSFDGSLSYIDFRFVSALSTSAIVPGVTQAAFVPKWKYALGAQYLLGLGRHGTLTPRLDYSWQSAMQSSLPNSLPGYTYGEVAAYGLLNARLTYQTPGKAWQVSLAATNLLDKFYYINKFDQYVQSGLVTGQPGRPREVMVTIKRNF